MHDPDEPANDNGLDDDEAHYLGFLDTLPAMPVATELMPIVVHAANLRSSATTDQ